MSVSSITPSFAVDPVSSQINDPNSWRKDFRQLAQALSSGNLESAKAAFTALGKSSSSAPASPGNQNSPLAQDFQAIGKALQSGDLSGAQQAFAKLKQDAQAQAGATGQAHRVRGQHAWHRGNDNDQPITDATKTPVDPAAPQGTRLNVTL